MTTLRTAAQQALEALEFLSLDFFMLDPISPGREASNKAITALRAALAEPVRLQCVTCGTVYADGVPPQVPPQVPVQEPVAWLYEAGTDRTLHWYKPPLHGTPLYTAPPQRKPLTEVDLRALYDHGIGGSDD